MYFEMIKFIINSLIMNNLKSQLRKLNDYCQEDQRLDDNSRGGCGVSQ